MNDKLIRQLSENKSENEESCLKTSLYNLHLKNKGKMVKYSNYMLPLEYKRGIIQEHKHCRQACSVFDVSHMGQILIEGEDRKKVVEKVLTAAVPSMNKGTLGLLLNHQAGILDDCITTHLPQAFHMVVNAANKHSDLLHILQVIQHHQYKAHAHLLSKALIAVQGPYSQQVLQSLFNISLDQVKFMDHIQLELEYGEQKQKVDISRCGYTGEDGFELSVEQEHSEQLVEMLLSDSRVQLCGLGARDSLRLEAGLCLYGNDIHSLLNPITARLQWTLTNQTDYIGAIHLTNILSSQRRLGFKVLDKGIVRQGSQIVDQNDQPVGMITSGTMSPMLGYGIAMGYLNNTHNNKNSTLYGVVRNRKLKLQIAKMPFVNTHYYK